MMMMKAALQACPVKVPEAYKYNNRTWLLETQP